MGRLVSPLRLLPIRFSAVVTDTQLCASTWTRRVRSSGFVTRRQRSRRTSTRDDRAHKRRFGIGRAHMAGFTILGPSRRYWRVRRAVSRGLDSCMAGS